VSNRRDLRWRGGDTSGVLIATKGGHLRPETIRDSAAAADLTLSGDEVARLDAAAR
jgi:hypothetical protein